MTLTELVEMTSERIGAESQLTWGFVRSFFDVMTERLDAGDEVKIRGLGTFKWVEVPARTMTCANDLVIPPGRKLRFFPSKQFRTRRAEMPDEDEGMNKYGVVTDDDETKTASKGDKRVCPVCGETLDDGGACPKHGTKPFEPNGAP